MSLPRIVGFLLAFWVPGGQAGLGLEPVACAEDAQEVEEHALLALKRSSHMGVRAAAGGAREHLTGQRPDDFSVENQPSSTTPTDYGHRLPIPQPLPLPNPAKNPLIKGHVPENCTETWPFFKEIEGDWEGSTGLNFISLPQFVSDGKPFLVQVNRYSESTSFGFVGPVLNRGYLDGGIAVPRGQSDQVLTGLHYEQSISDRDLNHEIHHEMGFLLHQQCRPVHADRDDNWQVSRMGTIPHGSQVMGFGNITDVQTPAADYYVQMLLRLRESYAFSVLPFVPGPRCGTKEQQQHTQAAHFPSLLQKFGPLPVDKCCLTEGYMLGSNQCPDTGCPEPIDELIQVVKDLNVVSYTELDVSTATELYGGGIQNTPFVNINAEAPSTSLRSRMWALRVRRPDGSEYSLLQYIQLVNLLFLPFGPNCPRIAWPHVAAQTLKRKKAPGQ